MLADWNERIIERLYCETGGEVDKPFPVVGDILAVYMMADRLFEGSPQGWYVVTARQLKKSSGSNFYCYSQFQADIIPIPDNAVPWKGQIDPWLLRSKLSSRPIWVRLSSTEDNGCSYYNLSDWIRAKRTMYDQRSKVRSTPQVQKRTFFSPAKTRSRKRTSTPPASKKTVKRAWRTLSVPRTVQQRKRRKRLDEYVYCDSESLSSSDEDVEPISKLALSLGPILMTGKVHAVCNSGSASTAASAGSTPRPPSKRITESSGSLASMPKYMEEAGWVALRESTQQELLGLLSTKNGSAAEWLVELSFRLEQLAVFNKCMRSQDRYEGISRTVGGILKHFECLSDAIETLIPVDDDLRAHLEETETQAFTNEAETLSVALADNFESPFAFI